MNTIPRFEKKPRWCDKYVMKRIDQFPVYELGGALSALTHVCSEERPAGEVFGQVYALWNASKHLNLLLSGSYLTVSYCRPSAEKLRDEADKIFKRFDDPETGGIRTNDGNIPRWELYGLKNSIEEFEHQFSAELKQLASYSVSDHGIFETNLLIDSADRHIHESVRPYLPTFALSEYRSAGRSLAFGLYSASGYHSARAVESVLRRYYEIYMGQPPKKEDASLGLMISHLNDLCKKKDQPAKLPPQSTIRRLRDFAEMDRNPLIHATKEIDLQDVDAATLFNTALGALTEMGKELSEHRQIETIPGLLTSHVVDQK